MTEPTDPRIDAALDALNDVMRISESDTSRVQAAKALLDRLAPKDKSHEEQNNEAAERDAALAEARGLLAEFAALKLAFFREQRKLAAESEA